MVGGGCQSCWGRLLSVTNAIEAGTCRSRRQWLGIGWAPWRGRGGGVAPSLPLHLRGGGGYKFVVWQPPAFHPKRTTAGSATGTLSQPNPRCGSSAMMLKVNSQQFAEHSTNVDIPKHRSFGDLWAQGIFILLVPGIAAALLLSVVLWLLPLALIAAYSGARLRAPLPAVPRDCGFWAFVALLLPLALPLVLVAVLWAALVVLVTLLLSLPVGLCRPARTAASWRTLRPYLGRPGALTPTADAARSPADVLATGFGLLWPFSDLVCAIIGGVHRQRFAEIIVAVVCMQFTPPPPPLGLGTHNPRFVAWPLELGLGTHNPRFVAWPLELGLGTHNPRFGVAPRVGVRDSQSTLCCVAPRVGVRDSQSTLRCGPSSWG